jgi:prepilin-type N-terminal cleavage/methylation domain-containing protein
MWVMETGERARGARRRGFTLIEVMIVVAIIGVISAIAIPTLVKTMARARRTEMVSVLGRMQVYFINLYENQGNFCPPDATSCSGSFTSVLNPTGSAPGQPALWDPKQPGWVSLPVYPDGGVRMRYQFVASGDTLTFKVYGSFPGQRSLGTIPGTALDHTYEFTQTLQGTTPDQRTTVETPAF